MKPLNSSLFGLCVFLVLFFGLARATEVSCPVPTTFNPHYDTYADWQWDCFYYIDYEYVPDFPDGWRPPSYHGSDSYYGTFWDGYTPSGYWAPYVASACYWVQSTI